MEKDEATNEFDTILLPFLNSVTEKETETSLSGLIFQHIQPVIEKNLRIKLYVSLKPEDFSPNNQEALEIAGEAKLKLVGELRKLKEQTPPKIISNLNSYVISVTLNAYRQYLRDKYPLRQKLKSKLRYLLTHHPKFALWEGENKWFCGFKSNKVRESIRPPTAETIQSGVTDTVYQQNLRDSSRIIELLTAVFTFAKVPIFFNDLLTVVSEFQENKDQKDVSAEEQNLYFCQDKMLIGIEQREYLEKIWAEIGTLPVRHRLALLMNLREAQGDCVIRLIPLLRIASIRQIAEILDFSPVEFASIWNELPWEDWQIAEYLGLTRQQVINLRQSARSRLLRQTKNF